MGITNLHNLTKFPEPDEFINVKRLEKGLRSIFVPHSPGVYISINLNSEYTETNFDVNKYFKCNAILNIYSLDAELRELLM